jgi:hypothetical protein
VNPVVAEDIKQIGGDIAHRVSNTGGARVAQDATAPPGAIGTDSGLLGTMREDADLLDTIVGDAMRRRRLQAWCPSPADFAALESIAEETGQTLNELLDQALRLLLERRGRR